MMGPFTEVPLSSRAVKGELKPALLEEFAQSATVKLPAPLGAPVRSGIFGGGAAASPKRSSHLDVALFPPPSPSPSPAAAPRRRR